MLPLDPLPCHPSGWDTRVASPLQPLRRSLRLGRTGTLHRALGALATRGVVGPRLGEREYPVEHDRALGTRIAQTHPTVTRFHAACWPPILARHPSRMPALCVKPRLIDDEPGLGVAQRLDHIGLQVIPDLLGIPRRPPSQMLDLIGRRLPMDFSHVPSVFTLDGTPEPPEVRPRPATGFTASKTGHEAAFDCSLPDCPGTHRLPCRVSGWVAQLLPLLHGSVLHKVCATMIAYDLQL